MLYCTVVKWMVNLWRHLIMLFCVGQKANGVTSKGRRLYKTSQFSTNISLYLGNHTRYDHSYCRSPVGARMLSIEWCHCW